jgi:Copine/C2 domain
MHKTTTMMIELSIHAVNLKNLASTFSNGKSDPFAVVTHIQESGAVALGRTETIYNTTSPQWVKIFILDYEFGSPMKLVISIFDDCTSSPSSSSSSSTSEKTKPMGSAVFDVPEILGTRGATKAKRIPSTGGTIFAHVRKAITDVGVLRIQLSASNIKNTEGYTGLRKPDPFYEISRRGAVDMTATVGAPTWDNVYRSIVQNDTLNPSWDPAVLDLGMVCGGNQDAPIRLSIYDYEKSGRHVLIGQVETSVNGFIQSSNGTGTMDLMMKGNKTGVLNVTRADVTVPNTSTDSSSETSTTITDRLASTTISSSTSHTSTPVVPMNKATFLDYVTGGCHLNCVVAIDFTGSNGDPRKVGTLHHLDEQSDNPYEKAIKSIVPILAKYDTDQHYPVLGFGAKYNGIVNQCFQVGDTEESIGVNGVLASYRSVFKTGLIMSSPTDFTQVMEAAAQRSTTALEKAQQVGQQSYTILLIVTDGAVSDIDATAACVQSLSDHPLSVVIVGVGDADFTSMKFLDDVPNMKRDFIQFVELNQHTNQTSLTNATLHEIPDQLANYFIMNGIAPNKAIEMDEPDIVVEDEEEDIDLSIDVTEEDIVVTGTYKDRDAFW